MRWAHHSGIYQRALSISVCTFALLRATESDRVLSYRCENDAHLTKERLTESTMNQLNYSGGSTPWCNTAILFCSVFFFFSQRTAKNYWSLCQLKRKFLTLQRRKKRASLFNVVEFCIRCFRHLADSTNELFLWSQRQTISVAEYRISFTVYIHTD